MIKTSARIFLLLVGVVTLAAETECQMMNKLLINPNTTLRRFPYHVTISFYNGTYIDLKDLRLCEGSILNARWTITTADCSSNGSFYSLSTYANKTAGPYIALVENDTINYYGDIALVRTPFKLVFSDFIQPVRLNAVDPALLQNELAVMAVKKSSQLTNAMFNIISSTECSNYYDSSKFDKTRHLCAMGWSNNSKTPGLDDQGSRLVVGWPYKPELVGLYTGGKGNRGYPAIFTSLAKYNSWIKRMIAS